MPVYALNLNEAYERFHHAMGQNGCDYEQYRVVTYRQIREKEIRWYVGNHKDIVRRLPPDDRLAFLSDRQTRQRTERGRVDGNVTQMLNQLQPV